jgi:hypothetical protein
MAMILKNNHVNLKKKRGSKKNDHVIKKSNRITSKNTRGFLQYNGYSLSNKKN